MENERAKYYSQRAMESQRSIVNFKSSTTLTSEAFIWTYRTTSCDVISIITTTTPIKDGLMKDIKLENREIRRLKPAPMRKPGKPLLNGSSPLELEFAVDAEQKRKKANKLLQSEKNAFMAKLNISRYLRTKVENDAATKIQAVYRGHYTRISMIDIEQNTLVNRKIRSNIRSYLANKFKMRISLDGYKQTRVTIRNQSAALIQCLFMRYLARKCLRRRRQEHRQARRLKAIVVIQAFVRGTSARARVKLLVERIHLVMITKSALKIQTAYRGLIGRRIVRLRRIKLRMLASRQIQNWYRAKYTRQMAAHIKKMLYVKNTNRAALFMQGIVRRYVARKRVDRIRLRRLHKVIFRCVTIIQCMIRKFLAKIFVSRRRVVYTEAKEQQEAIEAQRREIEEMERTNAENLALLESVNIYLQARRGNTSEVEDIFKGLVSTEDHSANDIDASTGDTLLTIAASTGNMDLFRKALLWGFDINHRNDEGFNALMLAARGNHYSMMQYILTPPENIGELGSNYQLDPISPEDGAYLLVTATANSTPTDWNMLTFLLSLERLDVNGKVPATGMTPILAACELGNLEVFKLLMKNKAQLDVVADEMGQTPLHKAAGSSLKIAQLILGLDPNFNTYMSELARAVSIVSCDGDGKDCILLAALGGQTSILELFEETVKASPGNKSTKSKSFNAGGGKIVSANADDIQWSVDDLGRALKLVESGNLLCIKKIIDLGFDPNWSDEDTKVTMAIAACKIGNTDVIDILMDSKADFSLCDTVGRTAAHYAALCSDNSVIIHLLTHSKAKECNISEQSLLAVDINGENPFHLTAREGKELNVDLLASKATFEALAAPNKDGFTPLLLACSYGRQKNIQTYINLGADVNALDALGRGCLWHLTHPNTEGIMQLSLSTASNGGESGVVDIHMRRPFGSELFSQSTIPSVVKGYGSLIRKEKDDDAARLAVDISILTTLLKAGSGLYTNYGQSVEEMMSLPVCGPEEIPTTQQQINLQPGDVLIQELGITCVKNILSSNLLNPLDAWRLLISSLRFDDGNLKMFNTLLRSGIIEALTKNPDATEEENSINRTLSEEISEKQSVAPETVRGGAKLQKTNSMHMGTLGRTNSQVGVENFQLTKLQDVYFLDMNLAGWIIRLGHLKALQLLVRKGFDVTLPVESNEGNNFLHYIARYGIPDMVDVVVTDKRTRFEALNTRDQTAGMIAAKYGNNKLAKRLFEFKASPRKALEGKYAAWLLAFVRRKEKVEMNLQTGRFGDDDEKYSDISPDPFYITWYSL